MTLTFRAALAQASGDGFAELYLRDAKLKVFEGSELQVRGFHDSRAAAGARIPVGAKFEKGAFGKAADAAKRGEAGGALDRRKHLDKVRRVFYEERVEVGVGLADW